MILETKYLPAIRMLKQGESVWVANTPRAMLMASKLLTTGQVKLRSMELSAGKTFFLVPIGGTVAKYATPEPKCPVCNDTGWVEPHDCGCAYEAHCKCSIGYDCPDCDGEGNFFEVKTSYSESKADLQAHLDTYSMDDYLITAPAADTVQVSWWQDGARKGLHANEKYPVLDRRNLNGTDYVIVDLMGKPKGVKAEYTRKVAA